MPSYWYDFSVTLQHGKIKDMRIVTNRAGVSRGYAYIEYEDEVSMHFVIHCRISEYFSWPRFTWLDFSSFITL